MGVKVDYANKIDAQDLDTIYITGGGFVRRAFKGVSRDSAWGWEEPVWGGDLTRSLDFVLTNIEDVAYGLVARCEISYKYMNVQDYIDLCRIAKERVVTVDYFNREKGERVIQEMAFTGNELGKLYAFGTDYIGTQDVKIKLVATNREKVGLIKSTKEIIYNPNGGIITDNNNTVNSIPSTKAKWSNNTVLYGESFSYVDKDGTYHSGTIKKEGYKLAYWATKDTKGNFDRFFLPEQHTTIWENLILHAIWEDTRTTNKILYDATENGGLLGIEGNYTGSDSLITGESVDLDTAHRYGIKEGWSFVGWNTDKNATTALENLTVENQDITLYAIYKKQFSVEFYQVGDTTASSTTDVTIYNNETSKTITAPIITDLSGKTIVGWGTNASYITAEIQSGGSFSVSDSETYYAIYKHSVTISFNGNGGSGSMNPSTGFAYLIANKKTNGRQVSYSITLPDSEYTKTGYVFVGWGETSSTIADEAHFAGEGFTVTYDITLYAVWESA